MYLTDESEGRLLLGLVRKNIRYLYSFFFFFGRTWIVVLESMSLLHQDTSSSKTSFLCNTRYTELHWMRLWRKSILFLFLSSQENHVLHVEKGSITWTLPKGKLKYIFYIHINNIPFPLFSSITSNPFILPQHKYLFKNSKNPHN